nr:leucyl aminopeptidase [Desulfobulbaceae bacterium]
MKVVVTQNISDKYFGDMLVCCIKQTKGSDKPQCSHKQALKHIHAAHAIGDFNGKDGQTLLCYPLSSGPSKSPKRVLAVGLGSDALTTESFRLCGGTIVKKAKKTKAIEILLMVPEIDFPITDMCQALTEGLLLANYSFDKYKSKKSEEEDNCTKINKVTLVCSQTQLARKGVKKGVVNAEAVICARDMANEPGSNMTASDFEAFSLHLAKKYGFKRQVYAKAQLQKMGMGGILAVNRGSSEPPKMIVLEYRTGKKVPTILLVGKGLTFDSGGISIKPGAGMYDMKYDMCGGAAVMATMQAIGTEKPRHVDVVAIVPATDNMPGPAALKPGDIITQYNGKTVEVQNTDAEGRLILADALSYGVKKFKPDAVLDLATLTGAVIVGLGHHCSGMMSNDTELAKKIEQAGERCGEPVWRLPLTKEYSKQIESKIADLKNVGEKGAGTITAGAFLQEFVGDAKWVHLDIAGTAWNFTEKSYIPKGPSGVGVRLLLEAIRSW